MFYWNSVFRAAVVSAYFHFLSHISRRFSCQKSFICSLPAPCPGAPTGRVNPAAGDGPGPGPGRAARPPLSWREQITLQPDSVLCTSFIIYTEGDGDFGTFKNDIARLFILRENNLSKTIKVVTSTGIYRKHTKLSRDIGTWGRGIVWRWK